MCASSERTALCVDTPTSVPPPPFPCRLAQHRDLDQLTTLSANELLSVALGGSAGSGALVVTMVTLSFLVRVCLIWLFFFLLSVAERTYKQVRRRGQNISRIYLIVSFLEILISFIELKRNR